VVKKARGERRSPSGVLRGKDGIRAAFTKLLADVPNAAWDLKTQLYEGDVLFLEWAADAAATRVEDGIDTFVFLDGPDPRADGPLHAAAQGLAARRSTARGSAPGDDEAAASRNSHDQAFVSKYLDRFPDRPHGQARLLHQERDRRHCLPRRDLTRLDPGSQDRRELEVARLP
jgi:hypothetical protein